MWWVTGCAGGLWRVGSYGGIGEKDAGATACGHTSGTVAGRYSCTTVAIAYVLVTTTLAIVACLSQPVVDVVALLEAMEALALPPSLQELVAELFGLQDSVTLAELRAAVDAATLPGRDLLHLRRALDPVVRNAAAHAAVKCPASPKVLRRRLQVLTVATMSSGSGN